MRDVVLGAGEEVVHARDVAAIGEQALAQVRAEEAGAAGDEDAFAEAVGSHWDFLASSEFWRCGWWMQGEILRRFAPQDDKEGPQDDTAQDDTN